MMLSGVLVAGGCGEIQVGFTTITDASAVIFSCNNLFMLHVMSTNLTGGFVRGATGSMPLM